jgi:hypothetical protein
MNMTTLVWRVADDKVGIGLGGNSHLHAAKHTGTGAGVLVLETRTRGGAEQTAQESQDWVHA